MLQIKHYSSLFFKAIVLLLLTFSISEKAFSQSVVVSNATDLFSAVKKMNNGSITKITVNAGDYSFTTPLLLSSASNTTKLIEGSGTVNVSGNIFIRITGRKFTVRGLNFHKTIFQGNVKETIQMNQSQDCVIDKCNFSEEAFGNDFKQKNTYFIGLVAAQRSIISNNRFTDKVNDGGLILFNQLYPDSTRNAHQIFGNYFGPKAFGSLANNIIMRLGLSGDKNTESANYNSGIKIHDNTFEDYDAYTELISIKCSNVDIYDNKFIRCAGYISIRNGNDCNIYNNQFRGDNQKRTCGVRIQGGNHSITNNYFENLEQALLIFGGNGDIVDGAVPNYINTKNILISNNSIVNCKTAVSFVFSADRKNYTLPDNCSFTNNLFVVPIKGNLIVNTSNPDIESLGNLISFADNVIVQKEKGRRLSAIKSVNQKIDTNNQLENDESNLQLDQSTGRYKYKASLNKPLQKKTIGFQ